MTNDIRILAKNLLERIDMCKENDAIKRIKTSIHYEALHEAVKPPRDEIADYFNNWLGMLNNKLTDEDEDYIECAIEELKK